MAARVRIAPSPTGYFHVGTARTALFNWLVARQQGGTFVLRIEDTDRSRNQPEQIEGIKRALLWLDLGWDEGPYLQSERLGLHRDAIAKLLASGAAYACDCTPDAIKARVGNQQLPSGYDGHCRDLGLEPGPGRLVRFRTPAEGVTAYDDVIRGRVETANATIGDFPIQKSNGDPLFLLSNTVDDAGMAITHVIRGEDHVSNTPKNILLWQALAYGPLPVFAHTPLLFNQSRRKLSKRRDKVAVEDYRDEGFLPEAVCNYLALLGWAPGGGREIVTRDEMLAEFRLEDVKSAGAIFDERKLTDVNAQYLRALPSEVFLERATGWLTSRVAPVAPLVQERSRTLAEAWSMTDFLYLSTPHVDEVAWANSVAKQPAFDAILAGAVEGYADVEWTAAAIRAATVAAGEAAGVTSLGRAQEPIRLAVTGRTVGPPLFESLEALGRDRTVARLNAARARLASPPAS